MTKDILSTKNAPRAIGPYSQGVIANNVGKFIFFSGQLAIDPALEKVALKGETIEAQTKQVMQNIKALLDAANVGFENVIKTTIFLQDMADFPKLNEVYSQYFPKNPPARSTVQVAKLPLNALVEIECIVAV